MFELSLPYIKSKLQYLSYQIVINVTIWLKLDDFYSTIHVITTRMKRQFMTISFHPVVCYFYTHFPSYLLKLNSQQKSFKCYGYKKWDVCIFMVMKRIETNQYPIILRISEYRIFEIWFFFLNRKFLITQVMYIINFLEYLPDAGGLTRNTALVTMTPVYVKMLYDIIRPKPILDCVFFSCCELKFCM